MGATQTSSPPGWYGDPTGHSTLRYWSGGEWTSWVHDASGTHPDPHPIRRRSGREDLEHLAFVRQVFLPEARRRGYTSARADAHLQDLVTAMRARAESATAPETSSPVAGPAPSGRSGLAMLPAATVPASVPRVPSGPSAPSRVGTREPPRPREPQREPAVTTPTPSPRTLWWRRTREAVGSDLAVHGLAYLGVLLFFVGAFGLVVFAFGDVATTLRPLAEAVIAIVPFGAAALLVRRGAVVVGRALEVAGGLVLPVMVVTSFLDGVAVPPDLSGTPLVVALTVLLGLVALVYAAWAHRHPASGLRYLVAPVVWLAVAMATMGLGPNGIPTGRDVATPNAWQLSAVTLAVVVTLVLCRWRPGARLSAATRTSAVPGLAVVAVLALLSWTAEGWPTVPALVTGALVVVALDLLGDRVPAGAPGLAGPLWWAVVTAGVAAGAVEQLAPIAAIAAVGFLAQLERSVAARRSVAALLVPAAGVLLALTPLWTDPWWACATFAALTLWAGVRRADPPPALARTAVVLDVAAAVAPVLALVALRQVTGVPTVLAATAGTTLVAALVPRVAAATRGPSLWTRWAQVVGGFVLLAAGTGVVLARDIPAGEQWTVVGAIVLLTAAAGLVVLAPVARPPVVAAPSVVLALWLVVTLDIGSLPAAAALGAAALTLTVLAHTPWAARAQGAAASLGLTGVTLGVLVAVVVPDDPWVVAVARAFAAAGLTVTCWLGARGRSPVVAALDRVRVGWAPAALTAVALPATAWSLLLSAELLAPDGRWAVVAVTAPLYAVLTRLPMPRRISTVAAWSAVGAAALAPLAATETLTRGVALAVLPLAVALLRTDRRHPVMTWTAWASLAPTVALLGTATSTWVDDHSRSWVAAFALVTVGGLLLVGGAVADLRGRRWEPRWRPSHDWALAPVAVGLVEVVASLALAVRLTPSGAGWVLAIAATALAATAVAARVGLLAGPTVLSAWGAFVLLAAESLVLTPWVHLAVVGVLLLVAEGLTRVARGPWWSRVDVPLLVAAVPVAASAMAVSVGQPEQDVAVATVGGLCVATAVRLRSHRATATALGATGAVLVLVAAADSGGGWLALALLGLSAALTSLAVTLRGWPRGTAQVGGSAAALAAWWAVGGWWGLTAQRAVDLSVVIAAGVVVVAAAVSRRQWLDPSWSLAWGGTATLMAAACALDAVSAGAALGSGAGPSWWVAAGLAGIAAALAAAASPVAVPWLRELAVVAGLSSLGVGLQAADATRVVEACAPALVSMAAAGTLLALRHVDRADAWRRGIVVLGALSAAWCLAVAVLPPTDAHLLVPALGAAAVQSAAIGIVLDRLVLRMAAPVLACGAWLVFAVEALDGNPQWVTVPVGLAILGAVGLWRADRRRGGLDPATPPVVTLESVGIAFLVGSAVVQTFTTSLAYAALVSVVGLGAAAWGGITRVRRRLVSGSLLVALGLLLLVAVPLVRLLPAWEGATLWVVVGGLGLVLVLVATMLERGRTAVRAGTRRLREVTQGWE